MKTLFSALIAVGVLASSQLALADCQSLAQDLYTAQGYQQRCGYQLKQTPQISAQFKEQKCASTLSDADKNKLLNKVNSQLNSSFNASKNQSCEEGKQRFN